MNLSNDVPVRGRVSDIANKILDDFFDEALPSQQKTNSKGPTRSSVMFASPSMSLRSSFMESPLNTNDRHAVAEMMRRSVSVSGKFPNDAAADISSMKADPSANEMQLQSLQDSPEMQTIMKHVCELHNNVAEVVKELIYRKDLAIKVDTANRAYVELFEKMLSEVLKIQRLRFKSQKSTVHSLQERVMQLELDILSKDEIIEELKTKNDRLHRSNTELTILNRTQSSDLTMLQERVRDLERVKQDYMRSLIEARVMQENYQQQRIELAKKIRAEEQMSQLKLMEEMRQQWIRESNLKKDHDDNVFEARARTLGELTSAKDDFKRPSRANSTQTEVDDDGYWDVSEGWVLPISGTVLARNRWRRAKNFVKCPSCRGVGGYIAQAVALYNALIRKDEERNNGSGGSKTVKLAAASSVAASISEDDSSLQTRDTPAIGGGADGQSSSSRLSGGQNKPPQTKQAKTDVSLYKAVQHVASGASQSRNDTAPKYWFVPDELLRFMINVPRAIMSIRARPKIWVFRRAWELLDLKTDADMADMQLSHGVQSAAEFLMETHLLQSQAGRMKAEMNLYELIVSLKSNYKKHPCLHTFARLFGLLAGETVKEKQLRESLEKEAKATTKRTLSGGNKGGGLREGKRKSISLTTEGGYRKGSISISNPSGSSDGVGAGGDDEQENDHANNASLEAETSKLAPGEALKFARKNGFPVMKDDKRSILSAENVISHDISSNALTQPMLAVYLYARSCLLYEYSGVYWEGLHKIRESSGQLQQNINAFLAAGNKPDDAIEVPNHVVFCNDMFTWVPLDRVIFVMKAFLSSVDKKVMQKTLNKIESQARLLSWTGEVMPRVGASVIITGHYLKFMKLDNPNGRDLTWEEVLATEDGKAVDGDVDTEDWADYEARLSSSQGGQGQDQGQGQGQASRERPSSEDNSKGGNARNPAPAKLSRTGSLRKGNGGKSDDEDGGGGGGLKLHPDDEAEKTKKDAHVNRQNIIIVNMDYSLQLLIEAITPKGYELENMLRQLYLAGDQKGDGLLTFAEFSGIISKIAPDWSDRKIIHMYRESIISNDGTNSSSIGPTSFAALCNRYRLVEMIDVTKLKNFTLSALTNEKMKRPSTRQTRTPNTASSAPGGGGANSTRPGMKLPELVGRKGQGQGQGQQAGNSKQRVNQGALRSSISLDGGDYELSRGSQAMGLSELLKLKSVDENDDSDQMGGKEGTPGGSRGKMSPSAMKLVSAVKRSTSSSLAFGQQPAKKKKVVTLPPIETDPTKNAEGDQAAGDGTLQPLNSDRSASSLESNKTSKFFCMLGDFSFGGGLEEDYVPEEEHFHDIKSDSIAARLSVRSRNKNAEGVLANEDSVATAKSIEGAISGLMTDIHATIIAPVSDDNSENNLVDASILKKTKSQRGGGLKKGSFSDDMYDSSPDQSPRSGGGKDKGKGSKGKDAKQGAEGSPAGRTFDPNLSFAEKFPMLASLPDEEKDDVTIEGEGDDEDDWDNNSISIVSSVPAPKSSRVSASVVPPLKTVKKHGTMSGGKNSKSSTELSSLNNDPHAASNSGKSQNTGRSVTMSSARSSGGLSTARKDPITAAATSSARNGGGHGKSSAAAALGPRPGSGSPSISISAPLSLSVSAPVSMSLSAPVSLAASSVASRRGGGGGGQRMQPNDEVSKMASEKVMKELSERKKKRSTGQREGGGGHHLETPGSSEVLDGLTRIQENARY